MALHISSPQEHDAQTIEVVGVPLQRRPSMAPAMAALQTEVERLRELMEVKDNHIASLETQVWAWRSQAHNEGRSRHAEHEMAWERERDLIRVLHHQILHVQAIDEREAVRRRWWKSLRETL